jgi:serine/threonine protein kinase
MKQATFQTLDYNYQQLMANHDPQTALAQTLPRSGDDSSEELPLATGQMVGNFRVVRLIGRGGMGAVYEAVHERIERRAAIKVLYTEFAQHPQLVARFVNEARAVNLARHQGMVEIFDFGVLPSGAPFILMEYLEGEPLSDRLHRAAGAALPDALGLSRQIAFALRAAHAKGIVHRDLKPENIIILRDPDPPHLERVKVLDFGVAKVASPRVTVRNTLTGVMLGTPQYMAPEQCLGLVNVDGRADVYALGVMLYEMLAGRLPFEAEMAFDYMAMHVRQEPPPLRGLNPKVRPEVEELVHQMLAKKPSQRPAMGRVATELALLEGFTAATPQQEPEVPPSATSTEPVRVLIVDDDPDLNAMLGMLLEAQGFVCRRLDRGDAVLETVREFRPQVVLLDVELPGKSGYFLCWALKSSPETRDTLVVLMSAKSKESDQKLGIAMQADAYVTKPFEMADLTSIMQLLLDKPG